VVYGARDRVQLCLRRVRSTPCRADFGNGRRDPRRRDRPRCESFTSRLPPLALGQAKRIRSGMAAMAGNHVGHRSLARRTVRPDGPPSARVTVRVGRAADRAGRPCGSLRQHGQQHPASRTSPSSRLARLGWRAGCTDRVPQLSSGHSRDAEARHASRGSRDDRPRLNSGICAPRPNRDRPSSVRGPVHPPKLSPFRGLGEVITRHPPMLSLLSRIEGSMTTTSGD